MSVRLLVRQRSEAGGDQPNELILTDEVITLGRDAGCQVVLSQQAVSRNHARISKDGSLYFIEDMGSAYGTQINGRALPKGEKRLLRNGDVIAIAQFDVTFDRVSQHKEKTSMVARDLVKNVIRGLGDEAPFFRVMNGPREGEKIEVSDARELIIGREDDVDLVFKDDLVSRRHAKIRRDWSGTHVEDLDSRNGIRVNKKRVNRKTLKDRDELEVGGVRMLYLDPSEVRESPMVLPGKKHLEEDEGEPTDGGIKVDPEPPPEPEEPPPEPAPEPPPEEPPPDAEAAAEPPSEEPMEAPELPELAPEQAAAPAARTAPAATGKLLMLGVMGLAGIIALALILAVLVGA